MHVEEQESGCMCRAKQRDHDRIKMWYKTNSNSYIIIYAESRLVLLLFKQMCWRLSEIFQDDNEINGGT